MQTVEVEPFAPAEQRRVERYWLAAVRRDELPAAVRRVVRASWQRCLATNLTPDLPVAPVALDSSALETTRERTDWLPLVHRVVRQREGSFGGPGHILTVFDALGRMLSSEGDPAALAGLAEINFAPGGLWTERSAGTNGPGTALAIGGPVHIVGAEHFCQAWHRWHCAAVPIRDPVTGAVLGVIDISGFRDYAHPHSLNLAHALVLAVEQMLVAREAERRFLTVERMTDLSARYPNDAVIAVDRSGRVLLGSPSAPSTAGGAMAGLQEIITDLLGDSFEPLPREIRLDIPGMAARRATWYPVFDGGTAVGGCLLLEPPKGPGMARSLKGRPGEATYTFADVIGGSPLLLESLRLARAAAATRLPVLLLGESGTGKEVFAQAIHNAGEGRRRPFVAVNCAALPLELIESELFGYVSGAFSGARREGGVGKFEVADGGTIFLDEIGELSPPAQAALLRVLQDGEITKVGSAVSQRVDVRIIAATNRDAQAAVDGGRLRADVYHRLNVLSIELPPLKERPGDIRALARRFLADADRELGRPDAALSESVFEQFERYPWPGNVRELKNLIRRLVTMATAFPITSADLPSAFHSAGTPAAASCRVADRHTDPTDAEALLIGAVASAKTMAEAASRLGITRSTLYRRIQRYRLRSQRVLRRH